MGASDLLTRHEPPRRASRRVGGDRQPQLVAGRRSVVALGVVSTILFLTFLDNTIISVVLPNVQSSLHAGLTQLQWVVNGYALTFAGFMICFGAAGDLFGRKKVMLAGVGVFCAGSVLSALATSPDLLIAGRVVMGVGAAASEPGTLSMIRHLYPERGERARALGIWAAVSGLALALGPVVGGVLVALWSWRAIFWFNLILGLVALAVAAVSLPENADPVGRLDVGGGLLIAGALTSLSFAVIAGESSGYRTWWILLLFAAALGGVVAFVGRERRADNPLINLGIFRRRSFTASNVVAFSTYFGTFALFFFVALYLQFVGSQSSATTALDFVPMASAMIIAALLTGRWVARVGARTPMVVGCLLAALGITLTDQLLSPTAGLGTLGWTLALAGAGFGVAIVPVTATALSAVAPEHSGMAASTTNTSRELGAVVGVAVLGSVVNGELTVNLVRRLSALGIPAKYRDQVVTAVTTGTINTRAEKAASKTPSIEKIVHEVVQAAYSAFGHALDLSLWCAAGLMVASAVVALALLESRKPPGRSTDEVHPAG